MLIKKFLTITPLIVSSLIAGCIPWSRERPAYADLCETRFEFQIPGRHIEKTVVLRTYLYDYDAQWLDEPFQQLYSVKYVGEKYPKPEFYVQIVAYEKNRSGLFRTTESTTPIIYDAREAYITFDNGAQLKARPEIHLGSLTYDYPLQGAEYVRPSPYDINSAEVQRRIPKITNENDHGSAYVIFKTSEFNASSKWSINLGSLLVEGQRLEIPQLKLCYHPVKKWIGIEPLMRP
jgi:hypothetical protein